MADRLVLYEVDEKVGVITLNRPEKLNAISAELQQQLTRSKQDLESTCTSSGWTSACRSNGSAGSSAPASQETPSWRT